MSKDRFIGDYSPQVGDWVRVWGQVVEPGIEVHPEEVMVLFETHNEQFKAGIRRDHVKFKPGKIPEKVERCHSMVRSGDDRYFRCRDFYEHPGDHGWGAIAWSDEEEDGIMENRG